MSTDLIIRIISIVATVILFLFAVHKFSKHTEDIFHDRIKEILHKWTKIPVLGSIVGFIVTSIVQSSTAISVLLVTMTRNKLLTVSGALAVLIGVNLGTTLTIQLLPFKILEISPYIVALGLILMKTNTKLKIYGESIFYFGIIFLSLYLISYITHPFAESQFVIQMATLSSNIWIGILIGFILTNILQSSTLTTSLIVILVMKGVLNFEQSFALILGSNIGTTTTALLSSLVSNKDGKRIALAHFLFNFLGVAIILPFIDSFSSFVQRLPLTLSAQVAFSHFLFNLIIALVALLLFKYYYNFLYFLLPTHKRK